MVYFCRFCNVDFEVGRDFRRHRPCARKCKCPDYSCNYTDSAENMLMHVEEDHIMHVQGHIEDELRYNHFETEQQADKKTRHQIADIRERANACEDWIYIHTQSMHNA